MESLVCKAQLKFLADLAPLEEYNSGRKAISDPQGII